MKMEAAFNRRMRETRTSGGVGGCRGAIPGIRPDLARSAHALRLLSAQARSVPVVAARQLLPDSE
jgi:hypothetical protein